MTREEVLEQVKKVIVESLGVDPSEIVETASLSNDLGADSLDSVELIMSLEELGVTISDVDAEELKTVGQVVDYILAHKA